MRTGKMRHRVTVKTYVTVSDGAGGKTATPSNLFTTWADVSPMSAERQLKYGEIIQGTLYEITMRYRMDLQVDNDKTIDFKGRTIVLHSVINKGERDKVLQIIGYEKQ
jgi:SPP1 family predicted phage head-tail adaptor